MICPECGIDRNAEPIDQSDVCYCRTDRRRTPVLPEHTTRFRRILHIARLRGDLAAIAIMESGLTTRLQ